MLRAIGDTLKHYAVRAADSFAWTKGRKYALKSFMYRRCERAFKEDSDYCNWMTFAPYLSPQVPAHAHGLKRYAMRPFDLTTNAEPTVSVVIAVNDRYPEAYWCLRSIHENAPSVAYEVIVVHTDTSAQAARLIRKIGGVQFHENGAAKNSITAFNFGAKLAKGRFLHFLHADTEVTAGWLDELRATFDLVKDAGIVGPKLIFADGRLKGAGGRIFNDGSFEISGHDDDPCRPEYNYMKDVDFVSPAGMMIKADLFVAVGGFTDQGPWLGADLSLRTREQGLRVLYQPMSAIAHFENESINAQPDDQKHAAQFLQSWQSTFQSFSVRGHSPNSTGRDRRQKKVLVIDRHIPMPDQDSGSNGTFQFLKMLTCLGHAATFVPHLYPHYQGKYTRDLQRIGSECVYPPYLTTIEKYLEQSGRDFDLVVLKRCESAFNHLPSVMKWCPDAKLIFEPVDLHFLREGRQAKIENTADLLQKSELSKEMELKLISSADATVVNSTVERDILAKEAPESMVYCLPLIRDIPGRVNGFEQRKDLFFLGGFGHEPNSDAMHYFVESIWPLVHQRLPEARFLILGSRMSDEIRALAGPQIEAVGYVEDLTPYMERCRLAVVPLRYGAGTKGKIVTTMNYGVPMVVSPVAVEGMALEDNVHVLVRSNEAEFADAVVTLYSDCDLWLKLSNNGLKLGKEWHSFESGCERVKNLFADLGINGGTRSNDAKSLSAGASSYTSSASLQR